MQAIFIFQSHRDMEYQNLYVNDTDTKSSED